MAKSSVKIINVETKLPAQLRRWTIKTNYVVTDVISRGKKVLWKLAR